METKGISAVTGTSLKFTINNFSKLYDRVYCPDMVKLMGLPFDVYAEPVLDKVTRSTFLGVFLRCGWTQGTSPWTCNVRTNLKVISQNVNHKDYDLGPNKGSFDQENRCWCFGEVFWYELVSPEFGHVLDDTIILEMEINVTQPCGIPLNKIQNDLDSVLNLQLAAVSLADEIAHTSSLFVVRRTGYKCGKSNEQEQDYNDKVTLTKLLEKAKSHIQEEKEVLAATQEELFAVCQLKSVQLEMASITPNAQAQNPLQKSTFPSIKKENHGELQGETK